MRQLRMFAVALGSAIVATACATTHQTTTHYSAASTPAPRNGAMSLVALRDSLYAQSLADDEGPRASIRAEFVNAAGSRRVQGVFRLDDDAYVLIGHIDANGILRVVFPLDPRDDGFVRGDKTYRTQEFFAGFTADFRYQLTSSLIQPGMITDSYDMGTGYLFIIASWRPMQFDQISAGDEWDSFEVADPTYMRDPRPAIQELAAVLTSGSQEAYTVKFAKYYNSQSLYGSNAGASFFGSAFECSGFSNFGFGYDPFGPSAYSLASNDQYLWYRGRAYYYDDFSDCYRQAFPTYGYGYSFYGTRPRPVSPLNPQPPRRPLIQPHDRNPRAPRKPDSRIAVQVTQGNTVSAEGTRPRVSPTYRTRGLLTTDETESGGNAGSDRKIDIRAADNPRNRPGIQEMMQHRIRDDAATRGNPGNVGNEGWARIQRSARDNSNSGGARTPDARRAVPQPTTESRARTEAPRQWERPQRSESPRTEPQRSAPPQRSEHPRSEAPRSAPASSSGGGYQPRTAPAAAAQPRSAPPASAPHPQAAPPQRSEPAAASKPPASGTPERKS